MPHKDHKTHLKLEISTLRLRAGHFHTACAICESDMPICMRTNYFQNARVIFLGIVST